MPWQHFTPISNIIEKESIQRFQRHRMSSVELEDMIAETFKKKGYIMFTRKDHCDVLAVKPDMALAYLVECKDYQLSRKQQSLAVREFN